MSRKTIRAIFVRHGQSAANVGLWTGEFSQIPLTAVGFAQAEAVAEVWDVTPALIVLSPFLRTIQTAAPTLARFPQVPVETWEIHEFTFWDRAYWSGSSPEEQQDEVTRFWTGADVDYRMGEAESFGMLLLRAQAALDRLAGLPVAGLPVASPVLLFTHGHFIQALRLIILYPEWTDRQKMARFRAFDEAYKVQNTECVVADFDGERWRLAGFEVQ